MFKIFSKALNAFFEFFFKIFNLFGGLEEADKDLDRLPDRILWAAIDDESGIVLNKDGSMQITFGYRGPDLDSAVEEELAVLCAQVNNVLKRMSSGWVLYAEAQRLKSREYIKSDKFTDDITRLIEEERYDYFSQGEHFESVYYLTLQYLPPSDMQSRVKNIFIEGGETKEQMTWEEHLTFFLEETEKILETFKDIFHKENVYRLSPDETMTYLHSTVSPKRHLVKAPKRGMYIDFYLYDSVFLGGFEPRLGDYCVRIVSILRYPDVSMPGIFDQLNALGFEYRWMNRYIFLSKEEAKAEIKSYQKFWYEKRQSMMQYISKLVFGADEAKAAMMEDEDAIDKSNDSKAAFKKVSNDSLSFGYYTGCVVIIDKNEKEVEQKAKKVERIINGLGFTAVIETYNAVNAWLGSLPGMPYHNKRKSLLSTVDLANMMPISSIWAGQEENRHLNGPVVLYAQTIGNTPFRFDAHIGDLGHSLLLGPPGSGKSAHLALWAAQFCKYKNARVYFFDTGGSSRVLTAGVGGRFYDLAAEDEKELSFQVLAQIDDSNERLWVRDWLEMYLESQNFPLTEKHREVIWTTLTSLANSEPRGRTMSIFHAMVSAQMTDLGLALKPLTLDGALGKLFDSKEDSFKTGRWQVFEMEILMNIPSAVAPTLSYLFHRIEQSLNEDSEPTIIFLDECWKYLNNPMFMTKIDAWLRTLRKYNTSVVFATQSLEDIFKSPIAPTILNACKTKIFLPNPAAIQENMMKTYRKFDLNDQEIQIIALAVQKKHYYYKSELGSRIYDLALGDVALAYCGAGSKQEQLVAKKILAEYGRENFNEKWLEYKRLPEVWEKIRKERVR